MFANIFIQTYINFIEYTTPNKYIDFPLLGEVLCVDLCVC